jgi:hypothetical protein
METTSKSTAFGIIVSVGLAIGCDGGQDPFAAAREDVQNGVDGVDGRVHDGVLVPDGADGISNIETFVGLVINEVAPAGVPNDWFEVYNGTGRMLDLSAVTFSDDLAVVDKGRFAAGTTLEAGRYLVVIVSDEAVGFKLGGDEALVLAGPDSEIIDTVDWVDGDAPEGRTWGRWPDKNGAFRQLVPSPGGANAKPEEVEPEPEPEPLPRCGNAVLDGGEACDGALLRDMGCDDFGFDDGVLGCASNCQTFDTAQCVKNAVVAVVINEVSSSGDDPIELLNRGDAVDLSGWSVTDAGWVQGDATTDDHRWVFPEGTTFAAGGRLVLTKGVEHAFGLGGEDMVVLWDADGQRVDEAAWPADGAKVSWCRQPDGVGEFATCQAVSLGAANPAPIVVPVTTVVVIDELFYDEEGSDGPSVFTELWGPVGMSLDGWKLEGINGADDKVYRVVSLNGGVIGTDGRLVIATAQASGTTLMAQDLVGEVDWQNGPDAVRLVDASGRVVDAIQYGVKSGFARGEGRPAAEASAGKSLSRVGHVDTGDNAADFVVGVPTPGL